MRLCDEGAAAILRDDMTAVKLLAGVQGDLQAAAAAMPIVVPECKATLVRAFDAVGVDGSAVPALAAFGEVNMPEPESKPTVLAPPPSDRTLNMPPLPTSIQPPAPSFDRSTSAASEPTVPVNAQLRQSLDDGSPTSQREFMFSRSAVGPPSILAVYP